MVGRDPGGKRGRTRAVKPVLGNDPFERGAAPRAPVAATPPAPVHAVVEVPVPPPQPARPPAEPPRAAAAPPPASGQRRTPEAAAPTVPGVRELRAALDTLRRLVDGPGPLDAWGLDPAAVAGARPALDLLVDGWFRAELRGLDLLPPGPAVIVANHGGAFHWDGLVLSHLLGRTGRPIRPLLDSAALSAPVLGRVLARLGAVGSSPAAADRLLGEGTSLAVFPEGSRAAQRPWAERYRVHAFGRGGFVKVAARAGVPIVPCAIVGSEEASAPVGRVGWLAQVLAMPLLVEARGLPLGPLGALPLPSRWTLRFGPGFDARARGVDPEDAPAVGALTEEVRAELQSMLDEDVAARRSVYL